jgi:putative flippase GtrA
MQRLATLPRQLLWFMLVGALSTVLQTIVYVGVRLVVPATWASWIALLAITPLNTEAHRRITFNVKTSAVGRLHTEAGLTSVAVYLANLVVGPWFIGIAGPDPTSLEEAMILALTGSLIGGLRYLLLRGWVFAQHRHQPKAGRPGDIPGMSGVEPNAVLGNGAEPNAVLGNGAEPNAVLGNGAEPNAVLGNGAEPNAAAVNGTEKTNSSEPARAGATVRSGQAGAPAPSGQAGDGEAGDGEGGRDDRDKPVRIYPLGLRLLRRRGRRCLTVAGSRLRRARRSPAGRRSSAPDQRPASTR